MNTLKKNDTQFFPKKKGKKKNKNWKKNGVTIPPGEVSLKKRRRQSRQVEETANDAKYNNDDGNSGEVSEWIHLQPLSSRGTRLRQKIRTIATDLMAVVR
jgi:hypothetical protein